MGERVKVRLSKGKERRAKKATPKKTNGGGFVRAPERNQERRRPRAGSDAEQFGVCPSDATHFSLTKEAGDGSAQRCFLPVNGVAVYRFPVAQLGIEWVRNCWGPGIYKGLWLRKKPNGSWDPRGKMRHVELLTTVEGKPTKGQTRTIGAPSIELEPDAPSSSVQPAPLPPEVIDARVRAEQEIAALRIKAERDISAGRLELEREKLRLEMAQQIEALRSEFRSSSSTAIVPYRDDEDEEREPGPWDFLAPWVQRLQPQIDQAIPIGLEWLRTMLQKKGGVA